MKKLEAKWQMTLTVALRILSCKRIDISFNWYISINLSWRSEEVCGFWYFVILGKWKRNTFGCWFRGPGTGKRSIWPGSWYDTAEKDGWPSSSTCWTTWYRQDCTCPRNIPGTGKQGILPNPLLLFLTLFSFFINYLLFIYFSVSS